MIGKSTADVIKELRQLPRIRSQCERIYSLAQQDKLPHFVLHEENMAHVAQFIHGLIQQDYPTMEIPNHSRWRHFEAGGVRRHLQLESHWQDCDSLERVRRHVDLILVSVLLDAGAGAQWCYRESETGQTFNRSEGLGVASLRMFERGCFSSNPQNPFQVDATALQKLSLADLELGFQVSDKNPMVGLPGRLALLQSLGRALQGKAKIFNRNETLRPGHLIDSLIAVNGAQTIQVAALWELVIDGLEDVWPREGRLSLDGCNLGDVWHHSALGAREDMNSLVPFHKLSQWLTYSLLEPLIAGGFKIEGMQLLTGLPEYRNGGLFIDFEVLKPREPLNLTRAHLVDSEFIVEWRALTVVLLDRLAARIRTSLGLSENDFPLAKVLESGSWKAGRRIAAQKRSGGTPPIQVISDGTVF